MFDSVKQSDRISGVMYLTSLLVSLIAHAVVLCALVIVPLVFFNVLQSQELLTFLIEPPPPPVQPPPPSPPPRAAAAHRGLAMTKEYKTPDRIPRGIPPANDADVAQPIPTWTIPGLAVPGGQAGSELPTIETLLRHEPIKTAAPRPPNPKPTPIRVGTLEASKLVFKVNPVYPPLAVKAHVSGTVVLEAVVDEEGNVSAVKVLSGHAFLVNAAVQAVKQWKYSPTVLNGEPVPVIATVTVIFRLN
jgi:protein TonB